MNEEKEERQNLENVEGIRNTEKKNNGWNMQVEKNWGGERKTTE